MLRREFLQGSAIVGASLVLPRILRASSGMWAEGGERTIARVLTAKSTMVQNTPVIRSFAGNHTDLVSPWVMLDEFGPMRIEPGTLGMDIKAHPHAGITPTTYSSPEAAVTPTASPTTSCTERASSCSSVPVAEPFTKRSPATRFAAMAGRCTGFRSGSTRRRTRSFATRPRAFTSARKRPLSNSATRKSRS